MVVLDGDRPIRWIDLADTERSTLLTRLPQGRRLSILVVGANANGLGDLPQPANVVL